MDQRTISYLLDVQTDLEGLWPTIDLYNSKLELNDYSVPVMGASRAVEKMIILLANERGCEYEDGRIKGQNNSSVIMPYSLISEGYIDDVPPEIRAFIEQIKKYRNTAVHGAKVTYGEAVVFAEIFDCFVSWFLLNSTTLKNRQDPTIAKVLSRFNSFSKSITLHIQSHSSETQYKITPTIPKTKKVVEVGNDSFEDKDDILTMMGKGLAILQDIQSGVSKIDTRLNLISEKLDSLSQQIGGYQSLLAKQLDIAQSEEEIDRIIGAYADECTSRIIREVNSELASQAYEVEKDKLVLSMGEGAWNKLDPSSQNFLITAKVTYNNLISMHDIIDYSGVCLLVTKAIEVEMSNRFCRDYLLYLKNQYPGKENYTQYPTALLNKYGKPIRLKDFTLGSVAYVLCYTVPDDLDEEHICNNRQKLFEYLSQCLMKDVDEAQIESQIELIAEGVENIRIDYRNPSAHTNQLQCVNAKQCFDLVLDVEKLLKTIMDSMDH